MPEGPEIETMRRGLLRMIGDTIDSIKLAPYKTARNPGGIRALRGSRITGVDRHGKRLAIVTTAGILQVGAGMSGWWRLSHWEPPQKHDILTIVGDRYVAVFNDARRFGNLAAWNPDTPNWWRGLGYDGLDRAVKSAAHVRDTVARFKQLRSPIKPLLMDQSVIAGIGNIYASEICWAAGIAPTRRANSLTVEDVQNILVLTYSILNAAADGNGSTIAGANPHRTPDGSPTNLFTLKVYGREGLRCARCDGTIVKSTQVGRATYSCPGCQA